MRTGLRAIRPRLGIRSGDESGATAIIVALSLAAIFAMLVLTVDVGGLLLRRRAMVNASDAAALAAAQSCADTQDTLDPESQADAYAVSNVQGTTGGITEIVGCDTSRGHVSVEYTRAQSLFFAGVFGFGDTGTVRTAATAAWGPAAGGNVVPIVVDSAYLQGTCNIPDVEVTDPPQTCALYYNNGDSSLGDANWGYMNLDQWDVSSTENCSNGSSSQRGDWILNDFGELLLLNGDPPGSQPTYVCNDTGHSSSNWQDLFDRMQANDFVTFPVNDCDGQLDKSGTVTTCPSTPDKYDIIGFTTLRLIHVYHGDDDEVTGIPGDTDTCQPAIGAFTTNQVWSLSSSYTGAGGCPSSSPDTINASDVHVYPKKGAEYNRCAPGDASASCAYWYDPDARSITWRTAPATALKVQYGWSMNGEPGACGYRPSDPNAICLVTEWHGFRTAAGPIGDGEDFGATAFALCDLQLGSCPEES
jgi:Flp pilus assembly protein TadG